MSARIGTGWQTTLADLSLILFMVAASGLSQHQDKAQRPRSAPRPASRSDPVAVWVDGRGAPALPQWLAQQPRDPRQQVTVRAAYAPGHMAEALARAQALAAQAGDGTRIVAEPGGPDVRVVIGYDAPAAKLAQGLRLAGDAQHRP